MFFPPIRSAFPQEIKKNNKYIAKHITTHTYTHKYFPKKNFHILITPCSQRTLMDSPLVMKMCTNLSLLYYYSIDQRLVMDRVQAPNLAHLGTCPIIPLFCPFGLALGHIRGQNGQNFEPSLPKDHYYDILYMTGVRKKITPVTPLWFLRPLKEKKVKSSSFVCWFFCLARLCRIRMITS